MIHPRHLWPILIAAAVLLCVSCCKPQQSPDNDIAAIRVESAELRQLLVDANAKLDQLERRHWWLGVPPAMKPGEHSVRTAEQQAPDIRAAIGHALQAAADIVGRDKVIGTFEDIASRAYDKHVSLLPATKALFKKDVMSDVHSDIDKLISQ